MRSPSPEIGTEITHRNILDVTGKVREVYHLPAPLPSEEAMPKNRIPSPIIPESEELNLDYVSK